MTRKRLFVIALLAASALGAVAAVNGCATASTKIWDAPYPAIARASGPEGLARGAVIFKTACGGCHADAQGRATGRRMTDFPEFMGTINSANITRDPVAGVGAWSDAELARIIKTSIGKDGRARTMSAFPLMADSDVAAVIAFLRSDDPMVAPTTDRLPPSKLSFTGDLLMTFIAAPNPTPPTGLVVPPVAVTPEYGRYMAIAVYDCIGCHTPGMTQSDKKVDVEGMFGGGMENPTPDGKTFTSPNITFDATGLAGWSEADFLRAVRDGIGKGDHVLRAPMAQFRWAGDTDLRAIYAYLQTVPKVAYARGADEPPRPKATADKDPEKLFTALGCAACHGPGAPFADKLHNADVKDVAEVAAWIRDPQAVKPGAQMPTFAGVLDEERALALAAWVKGYAAQHPLVAAR